MLSFLSEEHKFPAFENRMPRKVFKLNMNEVSEQFRISQSKELCDCMGHIVLLV